jgi:hypothetical protein
MLPAMPCPVVRPMRALMIWTVVMSGYENNIVHSIENPNCAPTCEYVPMPLGSSSEAPVMNPGPNRRKKPTLRGPSPPTSRGVSCMI